MMKVLAITIFKTTSEPTEIALRRALVRSELEDLFKDDFVAHATILKRRKAARTRPGCLAA